MRIAAPRPPEPAASRNKPLRSSAFFARFLIFSEDRMFYYRAGTIFSLTEMPLSARLTPRKPQ